MEKEGEGEALQSEVFFDTFEIKYMRPRPRPRPRSGVDIYPNELLLSTSKCKNHGGDEVCGYSTDL